ncbi:nucleotide exchange factor GrpE [Methylomarinum vadi]|uniref:nucleotide exchange factor GrpE n=1 Tax=Methylomarinum vadi TaxID=438855 RepID=UPI0004DF753D|nr:nucleotide exchange factor GrpE [Methylomarinum vadi]
MSDQESAQPLPEAAARSGEAALEECRQALADCQQESARRQEALLRARAELDIQHKRAARELEKAHKYAVARLLEALLPVKDSLELGLDAAQTAPSIDALQRGMALTLKELESVLNEFGVEVIDSHGEPFDPERHEAISVAPVAELPPNSVAQVHQKGYLLHGRVHRPARVTVAKSP